MFNIFLHSLQFRTADYRSTARPKLYLWTSTCWNYIVLLGNSLGTIKGMFEANLSGKPLPTWLSPPCKFQIRVVTSRGMKLFLSPGSVLQGLSWKLSVTCGITHWKQKGTVVVITCCGPQTQQPMQRGLVNLFGERIIVNQKNREVPWLKKKKQKLKKKYCDTCQAYCWHVYCSKQPRRLYRGSNAVVFFTVNK